MQGLARTWIFWTLSACFGITLAGNVIIMHPVVSRSHEVALVNLGEELARRGHDVTVVRFKGRNLMQTKLCRSIFLEINKNGRNIPYMDEEGIVEPAHDLMWKTDISYQSVPFDIRVPISAACETLMENRHLLNTTSKGEPYDIAIIDLVANECGLALAHSWKVPAVTYWASVMLGGEPMFYGAPYPASYVPGMHTGYTDRMSFFQRAYNFIDLCVGWVFTRYILMYPSYNVYRRYLPEAPLPEDLIKNISGMFINSDWALDFPRPMLPNLFYIGCSWCQQAKPLPQDLEAFMQSAGEHGVIAFSLGATFNADFVPKSAIQAFLKAMARLPQKIIMKLEGQVDAELPPNILRVKWMPQQDILGHPQTRAFVSHCGMHGVMEAIYHEVPIVAMPIFADQFDVLARLLDRGIAVKLDKRNLQEELIFQAITKVLNDNSYKQNIVRVSGIMKDSPQTAMERAVYWIEYIIRHRGAPHLKSGDRHLNLFQYWMLDVMLFLTLIISFLFYILYRISRNIIAGFRKPKTD